MNAFGLWTLSNRFDRREVNGNEMKGSPTLHSNAFHVKCDKKLPLNRILYTNMGRWTSAVIQVLTYGKWAPKAFQNLVPCSFTFA